MEASMNKFFELSDIKQHHSNYIVEFDVDGANTLEEYMIGKNESGWEIQGKVHENYYSWVNYFEAWHPQHGFVFGDFEKTIYATSERAYEHFINNHAPHRWDYSDI